MTKCLAYYDKMIHILNNVQPTWQTGTEIAGNTILILKDTFCKDKRTIQRDIRTLRIMNKFPIPKKTPKKYIEMSKKERMVEKINKWILDSGFHPDEFDVASLVDSNLNYTENLNIVKDRHPILKASEKEQKLKLEKYAAMCDMDYTQLDKAHLDNFGYRQLLEMLESIFNEISTRTDYDFLGDIVDRLRPHAEKDKFVWDIPKMQPKP